jgi:hypothetical protein
MCKMILTDTLYIYESLLWPRNCLIIWSSAHFVRRKPSKRPSPAEAKNIPTKPCTGPAWGEKISNEKVMLQLQRQR